MQGLVLKHRVDEPHHAWAAAIGVVQIFILQLSQGGNQDGKLAQQLTLSPTPAKDGLLFVAHHDHAPEILAALSRADLFQNGFQDGKLHQGGVLKLIDQDKAAAMGKKLVKLGGDYIIAEVKQRGFFAEQRFQAEPGNVVIGHVFVFVDQLVIFSQGGSPKVKNLLLLRQEQG